MSLPPSKVKLENILEDKTASGTKSNITFLDKIINYFSEYASSELIERAQSPLNTGMIIILLFFGTLCLWSYFAPIEGAVIAPAQVMVSSKKKIIQHFEGGIIKEILAKEGDKVTAGQELIKLQDTSAFANETLLLNKLFNLQSRKERLLAEKNDFAALVFSDDLAMKALSDDNKQSILDEEMRSFEIRQKLTDGQSDISKQRIEQSQDEIKGILEQFAAVTRQKELIEEELESTKILLKSGSAVKPRVLALQKDLARATGSIGESKYTIARINQRINEINTETLNIRHKFSNEVINELKEVSSQILEVKENLIKLRDIRERTVIISPQDGVINNLNFYTVGGVISPGVPIMEIIPNDDSLLIEGKVSVQDIDEIILAKNTEENIINVDGVTGLKAKVRLSAYSTRRVNMINAIVIYISADSITDNQGQQSYIVKAHIPKLELEAAHLPTDLYPGMPAEIYITTKSKTIINYLLTPIAGNFHKAFRED